MMITRRLWRENRKLYVCSLCNDGLRSTRPVAWAHACRWNSNSTNGPPKPSGWGSGFVPKSPPRRSTTDDLADHEAAARRALLASSKAASKAQQKPSAPGSSSRASNPQEKSSGSSSPVGRVKPPPPRPSGWGSSGFTPRAPRAESKLSDREAQQNSSDPSVSSGDTNPSRKSSGWGSSGFTPRAPRAPQGESNLSDQELTARRALMSGGNKPRRSSVLADTLANQPAQRSDSQMRSPRPQSNEEFWDSFRGSRGGYRSERSEGDLPNWSSLPRRPRRDDGDRRSGQGGFRAAPRPRPESPPDTSHMEQFEAMARTKSESKPAATATDGSWFSKYSAPEEPPGVEEWTKRQARAAKSHAVPLKSHVPPKAGAPEWGSRQPTSREDRREPAKSKRGREGRRSRRQEDEDEDFDEDEYLAAEERRRQRAEEKAARKAAKLERAVEVAPKLFLPEYISVPDLARSLEIGVNDFLHALEEYGFEEIGEDSIFTGETAGLIAQEYGFEVTVDDGMARDLRPQPEPEDRTSVPPRPPVVAIMGHVDHGKTTLLDYLRKSSIVASEHGGITQHIGAFIVNLSSGKSITFLDTPGHAAFLTMRQRGAEVTDIVILVVAADDSVMPQTLEALKHARAAHVPIIVAITKCDKDDARVDQVKADLSRHGVEIEDYGGDVQVVPVSGKTGQGMSDLEENIVTLSEILDVRGDPNIPAEGWVLEASVKPVGKAATVLVKRGTLRIGDYIVCGTAYARVRMLRNEAGQEIEEAPPGSPVEVLGWRDELPKAGDRALQAPDESKARTAVDYRREMQDRGEVQKRIAETEHQRKEIEAKKAAEEAADHAEADAQAGITSVNFIVRADVMGSVEAVTGTIQEIGNNEVQPRILRAAAGTISESDVEYASMSNSVIVNFNNVIPAHIMGHAEEAGVKIVDHSVIYHLADDIKAELSDKLPDLVTSRVSAEAEVLQVFPINLKGRLYKNIAGCKIRNGTLKKSDSVRIFRYGEKIFDGKLESLKQGKKDMPEIKKGAECGVGCVDFQDLEAGDVIQAYEEVREKRTL